MNTTAHPRPHVFTPTDGSRTITLRDSQPHPEDENDAGPSGEPAAAAAAVGVLRLFGSQTRTPQRVAWDADVVDNEGCGKKKSKICCIYHKPRRFDESSSSESESDSGSDSDGSCGRHHASDRARPTRNRRHHAHAHGHDCRHDTTNREDEVRTTNSLHSSDSDSDMNAYEKAPKRKSYK